MPSFPIEPSPGTDLVATVRPADDPDRQLTFSVCAGVSLPERIFDITRAKLRGPDHPFPMINGLKEGWELVSLELKPKK
jgi:hypothetical protein